MKSLEVIFFDTNKIDLNHLLGSTFLSDANLEELSRFKMDETKKEKAYGFGHRVYKTYDPRALIIKKEAHRFLDAFAVFQQRLQGGVQFTHFCHPGSSSVRIDRCYR